MKKFISLVMSVVIAGTMATTVFAAKKTEEKEKNNPKVETVAKKEKKEKKQKKVKTPKVKKPKKLKNGFVRISGTTTAKAKIRILVEKKQVAAGQAKKNGAFSIKVKAKKFEKGYTIYAYKKIKGKVEKSEKKIVVLVENVKEEVAQTEAPATEATEAPVA